jgi:hypothetical protein
MPSDSQDFAESTHKNECDFKFYPYIVIVLCGKLTIQKLLWESANIYLFYLLLEKNGQQLFIVRSLQYSETVNEFRVLSK